MTEVAPVGHPLAWSIMRHFPEFSMDPSPLWELAPEWEWWPSACYVVRVSHYLDERPDHRDHECDRCPDPDRHYYAPNRLYVDVSLEIPALLEAGNFDGIPLERHTLEEPTVERMREVLVIIQGRLDSPLHCVEEIGRAVALLSDEVNRWPS